MDEDLRALLARLAELTDAELTDLAAALDSLADSLLDTEATDEVLEQLREVAEAVEAVGTEQDNRTAAAEQRAAEAEQLAERIRARRAAEEGDPEGDPAAEPEPVAAAEPEPEPVAEPAQTPEPVAASARAPRPQGGARTNARGPGAPQRPARFATPAPATTPGALVASIDAPGICRTGDDLTGQPEQLAGAFAHAWQLMRATPKGHAVKIPVVRMGQGFSAEYPEARQLHSNDPAGNSRRIDAVTSLDAIAASGGICAPQAPTYDLPVLGTTDRPARAMLTRFGADRGGIRTLPVPRFTDASGAWSVWTEANDADETPNPATKACLTVTCDDTESETVVDALVTCLRFGNFRQRYFPEQVEAYMRMAAIYHARQADTRILTSMGTLSTAVTVGQVLGTTRTILAGIDRLVAAYRSRHRLARDFPLRFAYPFWGNDQMRSDLARELPGSTAERLALADAEIAAFFRVRNVVPELLLDGETGQVFGEQGDGALIGWPSSMIGYVWREGDFLFLDGGTLDLGIFRDGDLNATNDFKVFSETFENVHFHGTEAFRVSFDTCPDGTTSGTEDLSICTIGS